MVLSLAGCVNVANAQAAAATPAVARAYIPGGITGLAAMAGIPRNVRDRDFLEALARTNVARNWNFLPEDDWREDISLYLRNEAKKGKGQWVESVLDESVWVKEIGRGGGGGLAGLLAGDVRAAQTYVGLSKAGPGVAETLSEAMGLRRLALRYADLLFLYGPALAISERGAVTPGGPGSEKVWQELVGVPPRTAGRFMAALLEQDEGRMVAWYAFLHELPARQQRFFLSGLPRARFYYDYFRESPEVSRGVRRRVIYCNSTDYLRGIPVGEDGLVLLPGGLSAWRGTGAKAKQESVDQVLLRVGRDRKMPDPGHGWGWRRLEAVAAIETARGKPLTEIEARMLAEEYETHPGLYGYFVLLRGMGEKEWRSVFRLADKAERMNPLDRNRVMGLFHGVAKLASLLAQSERVDQKQAASVVGQLSEELANGPAAGDWALASTKALHGLAGQGSLEQLVAGSMTCERRRSEFQQVLRMQRIPGVDASMELVESSHAMKDSGEGWEAVVQRAALAPEIPPDGLDAASGMSRPPRADAAFRAKETAERIRQAMSDSKQADMPKLRAEMEERAGDVLVLSVTGLVYAWYLRPYDLLASEDPWFTRKHRFVNVRGRDDDPGDFAPGYFRMQSGGQGSFAGGSLANFNEAAGHVATVGALPDTRMLENLQLAQLAVLRGTMLGRLRAEDFRAANRMVEAGRTWLEQAARGRASEAESWEMTAGLISPGRWQRVLADAKGGRAEEVRRKVTVSDMFWLGERKQRKQGGDPAENLRRWLGSPGSLTVLGEGPLMPEPAPYESIYRRSLPGDCAARMAELALVLAVLAGREGITPDEVEAGAERVAASLLEGLTMVDNTDWEAVSTALASITGASVRAAAREGRGQ